MNVKENMKVMVLIMVAFFIAACAGGDASFSPDPTVGDVPGVGDEPGGDDEVPVDDDGEEERDCFLDGFCYRECETAEACPTGFSCIMSVFDVIKQAKSEGIVNGRPPLAAEWADPQTTIPNWRLLKPNEEPERGDVTAYKLSGGGTAYSGHTGIMISDEGDDITNISAHKDAVFTIEGQFEDRNNERYRRFTGD